MLHAWTHHASNLRDVVQAAKDAMPDADFYVPDYPAPAFSSIRMIVLAQELADQIQSLEDSKRRSGIPYQKIILVGHSLGALLLRKAYLIACGQTQDCTEPERRPLAWPSLVSRMVLLAAMNRGWSYETRPANMGFLRYSLLRFAAWVWRWFRVGKLISDGRRGSPFIVNLRIQWLNLLRSRAKVPVVVQLLGLLDDVVTRDDNIDLQCGADFRYLRVRDTGHANVICFTSDETGRQRKEVFLKALLTPENELQSDYQVPAVQEPEVESVVFVMHGIRDYGDWTSSVVEMIHRVATATGRKVRAFHPSYGYFNMLDFLIQPERKDQVRWFMDEYTQKLALYPNAEISFVGHSNGTYLLGTALKDYAAARFDRVVLAGSVLPTKYPWAEMFTDGRVRQVLNYVATKDFIVAVFPRIFEDVRRRKADLGAAGALGFVDDPNIPAQDSNLPRFTDIRFVEGMHSAALVQENYDNIARFIVEGRVELPDPPLYIRERIWWVAAASRFCPVIWLALAAVALLIAAIPGATAYWMLQPAGKELVALVAASFPLGIGFVRFLLRRF